eukprot:6211793-Pleurochrysis_carterae.AAC.2
MVSVTTQTTTPAVPRAPTFESTRPIYAPSDVQTMRTAHAKIDAALSTHCRLYLTKKLLLGTDCDNARHGIHRHSQLLLGLAQGARPSSPHDHVGDNITRAAVQAARQEGVAPPEARLPQADVKTCKNFKRHLLLIQPPFKACWLKTNTAKRHLAHRPGAFFQGVYR